MDNRGIDFGVGFLSQESSFDVQFSLIEYDGSHSYFRAYLVGLLNTILVSEGLPQINIGLGINTGQALVGNMGSEQRFDYSVIGDAVNLASRLESSSKTLGKTLVIGEDTRRTIETNFPFEYIDSITVKGKTEKIKVYTIL